MEINMLKYGLENIPSNFSVNRREAVKGVVIINGKILLILTNKGDYKFPGGGLKKGENYHFALKREILEETGYSMQDMGETVAQTIEQNIDKYDENTFFSMKSTYVLCDLDGLKRATKFR